MRMCLWDWCSWVLRTFGALTSIGSYCLIQVLYSPIKFIRTPLMDEMEANNEIPRIINALAKIVRDEERDEREEEKKRKQ
jgi:hypothetical protein